MATDPRPETTSSTTPNLTVVQPGQEQPLNTIVQPGLTFSGTTDQFVTFLRQIGAIHVVEAPLPPPSLIERLGWWFRDLGRGITQLGVLAILLLLTAMAMGWVPGITLPEHFSFGGETPIEAPAPRISSGPSLSEKLDALGTQIGEIKGEVEQLKATPAPEPPAPVVEAPAPVAEPAPAKKPWRPFAPRAATPANP